MTREDALFLCRDDAPGFCGVNAICAPKFRVVYCIYWVQYDPKCFHWILLARHDYDQAGDEIEVR